MYEVALDKKHFYTKCTNVNVVIFIRSTTSYYLLIAARKSIRRVVLGIALQYTITSEIKVKIVSQIVYLLC